MGGCTSSKLALDDSASSLLLNHSGERKGAAKILLASSKKLCSSQKGYAQILELVTASVISYSTMLSSDSNVLHNSAISSSQYIRNQKKICPSTAGFQGNDRENWSASAAAFKSETLRILATMNIALSHMTPRTSEGREPAVLQTPSFSSTHFWENPNEVLASNGSNHGLVKIITGLVATERKIKTEAKALRINQRDLDLLILKLQRQIVSDIGSSPQAVVATRLGIEELVTKLVQKAYSLNSMIDEINTQKTETLLPELMSLLISFVTMWHTMSGAHQRQAQMLQQLNCPEADQQPVTTTEAKWRITGLKEIEAAICKWKLAFNDYVSSQASFMEDLCKWLSLKTVKPVVRIPAWSQIEQLTANPTSQNWSLEGGTAGGTNLSGLVMKEVRALACTDSGMASRTLSEICSEWSHVYDNLPGLQVRQAFFNWEQKARQVLLELTAEEKQAKRLMELQKAIVKQETVVSAARAKQELMVQACDVPDLHRGQNQLMHSMPGTIVTFPGGRCRLGQARDRHTKQKAFDARVLLYHSLGEKRVQAEAELADLLARQIQVAHQLSLCKKQAQLAEVQLICKETSDMAAEVAKHSATTAQGLGLTQFRHSMALARS